MQLSYLLIQTMPGVEHAVGEKLLKLDAIRNVNLLYGKFDLIAKVRAKSMIDLQEKVITDIQGIEGVESVKSLMVNHAVA